MDQQLLFSYGTLQDDKIQLVIFGRLLEGVDDYLYGFRLETITFEDGLGQKNSYPIAIASSDPEQKISGKIYELIHEEITKADSYEGSSYKRIKVKSGLGRPCWVYVKKD